MQVEELRLKRTPILLVRYFLLSEFAAVSAVLFPALVVDYRQLYTRLNFDELLEFGVFVAIAAIVVTLLIVMVLFVSWTKTEYVVKNRKITYRMPFRERTVSLDRDDRLELWQTFGGRVFSYGTISVRDSNGKRTFLLKSINDPAYYYKVLEEMMLQKDSRGRRGDSSDMDYRELILRGEDQYTEFKETLAWDVRRGQSSKEVLRSAIKTIAGFMNSSGGVLVIGVTDGRAIVGLDNDLKALKRKDLDGFENFMTLVFTDLVGAEYCRLFTLKFHSVEAKTICVITVQASDQPVFVKDGKIEEFFIRAGNATYPLSVKPATQYIDSHFKKAKRSQDDGMGGATD